MRVSRASRIRRVGGVALALALAACSSGHGATKVAWSTDWRHDSLVLVTADGPRPVLWGVDPVAETVEPLTHLPPGGDPRVDSSAQVLPLDSSTVLVTVPSAQTGHQTAYVVDRTTASVTTEADLGGARQLTRGPGGFLAVRAAGSSAVVVRYDNRLRELGTRALPWIPAYAAVDPAPAGTLCLVASGSGRARVAVVDIRTGRVRSASAGPVDGDVSAIACRGGRRYLGVTSGDESRATVAETTSPDPVLAPAWSSAATLVSVPRGQVQSLTVDAGTGHLIVGAAVDGRHELTEVDPRGHGRLVRRVPLRGLPAVTNIVATRTAFVVLAVDRVVFVTRAGGAVRSVPLPAPLLTMNTMAY